MVHADDGSTHAPPTYRPSGWRIGASTLFVSDTRRLQVYVFTSSGTVPIDQFESHIPEVTALYGFPIDVGQLVQLRSDRNNAIYRVTKLSPRKAELVPEGGGDSVKVNRKDLLAVKRFGERINPVLTHHEGFAAVQRGRRTLSSTARIFTRFNCWSTSTRGRSTAATRHLARRSGGSVPVRLPSMRRRSVRL
jgi:hypothetical protein